MRKFVLLTAALVLGASAAVAQERSIHAIGLDVPLWFQPWSPVDSDLEDIDYEESWSAVSFNLMYHHLKVGNSRFSSFIDVEAGYSSFSLDDISVGGYSLAEISNDLGLDISSDDSWGGFNTRFMFGLGFAPLTTDAFTLAVHGTFGVNLAYAAGDSVSLYNDGFNRLESNPWLFGLWTTVGANVDAVYRITGKIGVFAGVNIYTNLIGFSVHGTEIDATGSHEFVNRAPDPDGRFFLIGPGGFNVDFRIGLAFVL